MKTRLLFVPLLLALVASLAACGGGTVVPPNAVAVVNGTPIPISDFNGFFTQALAISATQGPKPTPGSPQYAALRNQVVAYLVQFTEVNQQAKKLGISVSQDEVNKFLDNLAKTRFNGDMKQLTATLKKQGLTMDIARKEVYLNLLGQKIRTKVTANATVSQKDEQAYYDSNSTQYHTPAQKSREVEHILVKSRSLANTLERQLQNGANFATLAKKYSKDPGSAAQGGKFTANQGREVPAYDKVAFALKTGALSSPVDATAAANGGYGWFIIRALAPVKTTPAHTTSFKDAQSSIQQTLLQAAQEKIWQQWLSDLTKQYAKKLSYQASYAPPTTTALPTTATTPPATTG